MTAGQAPEPRDPLGPWRRTCIVPYDHDAGQVAVFLDFENLVLGAGSSQPAEERDPIAVRR